MKLISDREDKINDFIPEEYWTLDTHLTAKGVKKPVIAKFYGDDTGKLSISSKTEMDKIMKELKKADYKIIEIKNSERMRKAPLPFTTSTLQQEASKSLNFSTQKTMRIAQQLYEGVEIKGQGLIGLISYLRTDSTRISEEADRAVREYINKSYGEKYVAEPQVSKDRGKKIQDAHEAIRPTHTELSPVVVKESLSRDQFRLYALIWKRFTASRMKPAVYDIKSVKISAGKYIFTASASKLKFDGFMSVYVEADFEKEKDSISDNIDGKTELKFEKFEEMQHFTQPPAHFTEASLVKTLEELGIGRPSTYAPTITTILARRYVAKENKAIFVTEIGTIVNKIMNAAFPEIVDTNFTAAMEGLLDKVEMGEIAWKEIVRNFYPDLAEEVRKEEENLEKIEIQDEVTEEICPNCGRNLVIKYGPHGKFLACPGFPDCRFTKPYLEKVGAACPICGSEVVIRKTKKGRSFYSCERSPECEFISWQKPSAVKCPDCGSYTVEKGGKLVCSNKECQKVVVNVPAGK